MPVESTAAAARRAQGIKDAAAIGHRGLAVITGLNILAKRIENEAGNWTRFVIIALKKRTEPAPEFTEQAWQQAPYKTSILFTLADRPGSLSTVLTYFAQNGINMRKLESRPLRGETWKYVFFADVEANLEKPAYAELLDKMGEICSTFRILGSYITGPQLDRLSVDELNRAES